MTAAGVLRKVDKLKRQSEELRDDAEGLQTAMAVVRAGDLSHLPVVMDMLEDWVYRLGDYLTLLINLREYLES